jgi:O-antigen/teichoic acid export membrane protein
MKILKEVGKDTLIYGFGNSIQKITGFLLIPLYTRYLTPDDYGVLSSISTFTFFASVLAGMGIFEATARYFYKAKSEDEKGRLLYTSVIMQLISYGIIVVCILPFSGNLSQFLFSTPQYGWVIFISLLLLLLNPISSNIDIIYRYYRQPIKFQLVSILRTIITPLLVVIFVVILKKGVLGVQLGQFISLCIITVFAFFYFARSKYTPKFSLVWSKKMLRYGFPLIWSGIAVWIYSVSDRFFLLHYSDLKSIGLYSIGNTFSQPILILNSAINMAVVVIIMNIFESDLDPNKLNTKTSLKKFWDTYLVVIIPLCMFISIFSVNILNTFTTKAYLYGALAIPFMSFNLVVKQGIDFTGNGMSFMENTKPLPWLIFISALVNVGLNFYFIPNFGFVGACITTILSTVCYFFLMYFFSQRYFAFSYGLVRKSIFIITAFGIAVFFPFAELQYSIKISIWVKVFSFVITLFLPFVFNLIDYTTAKGYFTFIYKKVLRIS